MPISPHFEYMEMMTHFMPSKLASMAANITDKTQMSTSMRLFEVSIASIPRMESGMPVNAPAEDDSCQPSNEGTVIAARRKAIIRIMVTAFVTRFGMMSF